MVITLTEAERAFCAETGDLRVAENKKNKDIAEYDYNRFNLNSQQSNRLAVMVEAAVYKWSGGNILDHSLEEWAHFVPQELYSEYLKRPDLYGFIEVRRANKRTSPLPIRTKDRVPGVILVHGYVPYTQENRWGPIKVGYEVELLGWAAAEDWEMGTVPSWAKNGTRVVSRRPMELLRWQRDVTIEAPHLEETTAA